MGGEERILLEEIRKRQSRWLDQVLVGEGSLKTYRGENVG
jgi:hypothetical protein